MKDEFNNKVGPELYEKKKTQNKLLRLMMVIAGIILVLSTGTQYFAHVFDYHEALGANFNKIYWPWKILDWAELYKADYPKVVEDSMNVMFGCLAGIMLILMIAMIIQDQKIKGNKYLHGSARWANIKDMEQAGLLHKKMPKGPVVYVGGIKDKSGNFRYLVHGGPEHVLCFAPTRSGKGVGLVVPTMLSWSDSVVCNDIKGELWALTSGWRQKYLKSKVIRLEFSSVNSAHWNPLDEIRIGTEYEVGDAQNLAMLVVDPDGKGLDGPDGHWKKTAFALYTGLILYVLYEAKNPMSPIVKANFHTIDMILSDKTRSVKELWTAMKEHSNPIVSAAGQDMLDRPDEEAGSVLSTVKSNLSLFRDPIVAKNVESSDFSVRDLMHHDSPVSLYLISQPSDKGRIRPMLRIFVCMCMRLLADKMEFKNGRAVKTYKHRLLMMLDEFPALGKMDIVQESLAFVAGYGIKCYLITQDLGQLYSAYGKDESITSNCHIQNCFPAIKDDTCAYISKMTGTTTIVKETKSKSGSGLKTNITRGIQEVKRELLTPGEVKSLPGSVKDSKGMILEAGKMLIFAAGFPPIFGQQPLYFKDPIFSKRSAVPEAKKSDILR
jgi:type IV secretion system protein VirD4